jgi:putative ABC transport system permease protein
MPQAFDVPAGSALWVPVTVNARYRDSGRWLAGVGRLRSGVTVEEARAEMAVVATHLEKEFPSSNAGWTATVAPLHDDLATDIRPQLVILMGGVALLLVMACVNVSSLTLSRALTRTREFAIRTALGAGRGPLLRQLLTESLVLCALGAAAGLVLGQWALAALAISLPGEMPGFMQPRMGPAVLAFTAALCLLAAAATAVVPALRLSSSPLLPALREGSVGGGVGPGRRRLRGLLVAGQMSLALVLVAGGGLLLRSYLRLAGVDAGFDPRPVLSLDITLPDGAYEEPAAQARFFQETVDRLGALPGAASAAGISWLPFTPGSATDFEVVGRPAPPPGQELGGDVRFVTPGFFRTLGIPVLEGRDFTAEDGADRPTAVIVNQRLAREVWPGESPLGKRIRMEWDSMLDAEVVGVVGDIRLRALDKPSRPTLYWSQAQAPTPFMALVVKSSGVTPESLTPAAIAAIRAVDRGVAAEARPLEEFVASTLERKSFTLALTLAFGVTAIALAAVGLFGVVAQAVGERRREFALRLALGARREDIRRMVLGEGFLWTAAGAAVGLPAALAAGRALGSVLFEVSPADPVTYGAVTALLGAAALAAVALPAWRAARVDPLVVLRGD